jgi:hypothetical protein
MCIQRCWTICARSGRVEAHRNRQHNNLRRHRSPQRRRAVRTAYFSRLHRYPMRRRSSTLLRHTQVRQYPPHTPRLHTHHGTSFPPTIHWTCPPSRRTSRSSTMAGPLPAWGLYARRYSSIPRCLPRNHVVSGTRRRRRCRTLGKTLSRSLGCISHHGSRDRARRALYSHTLVKRI